ncbi:MAG: YHYH protein [Actinobacteria bacterium]|jgi:YHYH protein|nr:YHYH protein [Actinomycetota bacterium]NBP53975.1 YHYH protein [Actinomycetota bacterium]
MCESKDGLRPHELGHPHNHPTTIDRRTLVGLGVLGLGGILLASCRKSGDSRIDSTTQTASSATQNSETTSTTPPALQTLAGFEHFAETVEVFREGDLWMVESDGIPKHNMMVGIKSWQQQFPLPQPYFGANAWRFPAIPTRAATPVSARSGLYRGAIAIAVNGVPIFNALNNRGDDAYLAGELDQWGGHCGRADDYHYHVAPLHLQAQTGTAPIAYALDGYPIYGTTESDGSAVGELDEWNGHADEDLGYHYHGTSSYPYANGGLVGVVKVVADQIDPQPVTKPIRPPGEPLRGAAITDFRSPLTNHYELEYTLEGSKFLVSYVIDGSMVTFTFTDEAGMTRTETYAR